MKKIFLSICVAIAMQASAQYSQWTYGFVPAANSEAAQSGVVLRYTDPGHIMAGTRISAISINAYVVKNDLDGYSTTAPYFNKSFRMRDGVGNWLDVMSSKVMEFKDGSGYGVGGVVKNASGVHSLFYMKLNTTGSIIAGPVLYFVSGINSPLIEFGNITENAAGDAVYLVGGIDLGAFASQTGEIFVHKMDPSGIIKWSNIYPIYTGISYNWARAYGAVENPSGTELAVVGTLNFGTKDGFFIKMDPANGDIVLLSPNWTAGIYGSTADSDELLSITYSNSDAQGNPRYLVAGMTNEPGDLDTWVMLLDQAGNVIWSIITDDAGSNLDNGVGSIVERQNLSGTYDYYAAGATRAGAFGGVDVHLVKGDVATGAPGMQYAYGGAADDIGMAIDYNNVTPGTGLAIFGFTKSFISLGGVQKMYFIKAYFNGEVGCNRSGIDFDENPGPNFREILDVNIIEHFTAKNIQAFVSNGSEYNLCHDIGLPDGHNDRVGNQKEEGNTMANSFGEIGVRVSPNPLPPGIIDLRVDIEAEKGEMLNVVVSDLLGREYVNTAFTVTETGMQKLPVKLNDASFSPGIYIVKVSGLQKPVSTVLIVK